MPYLISSLLIMFPHQHPPLEAVDARDSTTLCKLSEAANDHTLTKSQQGSSSCADEGMTDESG